jgi:hypothetical protein
MEFASKVGRGGIAFFFYSGHDRRYLLVTTKFSVRHAEAKPVLQLLGWDFLADGVVWRRLPSSAARV